VKTFTLENLRANRACAGGIEFVAQVIKEGWDVPTALAAVHPDWLTWAIKRGYDCESARRPGLTWDEEGRIAATAGNWGTATAGYGGTATAGNGGTATAGSWGTATAGDEGTATAGYKGTATAGDEGTATAGYKGTATAGHGGTATAGDKGTATAGHGGTATAGVHGTATAGDGGAIMLSRYDGRRRIVVGYVGEGGLKPNVPYRLDDSGTFVEAGE